MAEQQKKISFGFSKLQKKNVFSKPAESKRNVQLIDCLESHTIKLKNPVKDKMKGPLIIPLKPSENILTKARSKLASKTEEVSDQRPDSELSIDELAARELIRDSQNFNTELSKAINSISVSEDQTNDKNEPTLDDYEAVPINDFGMAMLRGMGWSQGVGIGKNNKSVVKVSEPELRPKGMGLGVNTGTKQKTNTESTENDDLILKKGGYAKVMEGNHKGNYCEIQGFDEEGGRIIVKTAINSVVLNLSEYLVKPVSKEEYKKLSKVLNVEKYDEYKSKSSSESSRKHTPYSRDASGSHRKHSRSSHRRD